MQLPNLLIYALWATLLGANLAQAASALEGELGEANQALANRDYAKAYQGYLRRSTTNPLAQFELGLMEERGWGRPVNQETACTWYEKAAQGGIPAAQQFLGNCYRAGIGRPADSKTALYWYGKAADSGILIALCNAGDLYISGQGVEKNINYGLELCTRAAQGESVPAMKHLADYYRHGRGIPTNPVAARYWYQQAAERHDLEAQFELALMLSEGLGGPADRTAAAFWLEQAARQGYSSAYLPLAVLYANAPVDSQSGALPPEVLAKVYLWNQAAKAITSNPETLAQISRIEKLTLAVMPPQWKPALDRQVTEHLAKFSQLPVTQP
ncbi:sel1 repeat family protein [Azospira inquinata]|uniref:Sel1 repeat family protein n=1 Tax=Azospira inquinata TaxID=2785627 RepID=A0A975XW71_9RHOO|nr:sel1 repeat family protein [Azospira inquinata]